MVPLTQLSAKTLDLIALLQKQKALLFDLEQKLALCECGHKPSKKVASRDTAQAAIDELLRHMDTLIESTGSEL